MLSEHGLLLQPNNKQVNYNYKKRLKGLFLTFYTDGTIAEVSVVSDPTSILLVWFKTNVKSCPLIAFLGHLFIMKY